MIPNYTFSIPTTTCFGAGVSAQAGEKARELGATKVLLVAGKHVQKAGLTKPVEDSLKQEKLPYIIFDQIVPNPRDYDCEAGYHLAKDAGIDCIIAVGGGSCMDTAKAIGVLLTHGGCIQDWCGAGFLEREITPLIAIPTTAGSGSEVTPFAVITDTKKQVKLNIFDTKCAAKVALVDPAVLLHLPSSTMAACGIDALVHAVEAYTCTAANPHTDAYSLYATKLIAKNLKKAVEAPDLDACTGMMLGSTIAGIAFGYADVAGVHCIAEALGGRYDMAHGVANAIALPAMTAYNLPAATEKYADIAGAMGCDTHGLSAEEAALCAVEAMKELCKEVKIPSMKDFPEIVPENFPALAKAAMENVSTPSNPREMTEEAYLQIIQTIYEEQ